MPPARRADASFNPTAGVIEDDDAGLRFTAAGRPVLDAVRAAPSA